jgi:dihydrofolate reductase
MGALIVTTNMTLDGIVQDPDGQEGFERGGWFARAGGSDLEAWAELETAEALGAAAVLLGRHSDEWFAARWTSRAGAWADRLNSLPKYVVSTNLDQPAWTNATVLGGNIIEQVERLKQSIDGEILVYASCQLLRTLIEHDLVDELRLVVFPVVLGSGARLFGSTNGEKSLRLVAAKQIGSGLLHVTYKVLPIGVDTA